MSATNIKSYESFYGWDMLYRTIENGVRKKADILVALTHYILTKEGSMLCIGTGDSKILTRADVGTELLPGDWNVQDNLYNLRYSHNNQLYLLLGHIVDNAIVLNMMNITKKSVANVCLDINELVVLDKGALFDMIPTASELTDRLRKELIKPIFSGYTSESQTQTVENPAHQIPRDPNPMRLYLPDIPAPPPTPQRYDDPDEDAPPTFPSIGRGDVDPLARGGPGNLFEIPQRPNLRGAQPRYDPMGPPNSNSRPNPNPDNLQPPGGNNFPPFT